MTDQPEPSRADDGAAIETEVLRLVHDLAMEIRAERDREFQVKPSSRLDRDLGLDSLARAELLLRIERALQIELPEALLAEAETPGDLIREIGQHEIKKPPRKHVRAEPGPGARISPAHGATSLNAALDWHAAHHADRTHIILVEGTDHETPISYGELAISARRLAAGLCGQGLEPGERVAIMLPTCRDFFEAFFGILYAGGVPVPIYPPVRLSQIEDHLRRQAHILNNCQARLLITVSEARRVSEFLMARVPSLRGIETVDRIAKQPPAPLPPAPGLEDLAFLQYTSGSTGDPKGVTLSHANLLENIRSMGEALEIRDDDVFVSWLPLYHDMGLIGAWLGTLYYAIPVVMMSPLTFLVRPASWLWAIHRHRGSLSGGPNFAFDLCLKRIEGADIEGLDLSSLRMVVNGAEPVQPRTIQQFAERFAPYGFRPEAMAPVYGLAENSVGLAFPPAGRLPPIDRISRQALQRDGRAEPAAIDDPHPLEIPASGRPLPRNEIRIVDDTGREVGERHEGRLQFRGPSATEGYFENPAKTQELIDNDWHNSDDLAYIAEGDIYITGRAKDIIIRAGRNLYPQEIEAAVSEIEGIRKGCISVFGSHDPDSGTEGLVVLAETRERDPAALEQMRRRIEEVTIELTDLPPDDVVLAPPNAVPKTSSGKIRRDASRQLYEAGRIGAGERAVWWQLVRLTAIGAGNRFRRALRAVRATLYAGYWWALLLLTAVIVWPLVLVLPGVDRRWSVLHMAARALLSCMGIRIEVAGREHLQGFHGIIVINHSSYADSLILAAVLDGKLSVIAKKELGRQFIAGPFLSRLGTIYVDRLDPEGARRDARRAKAAVESGAQIVFFPEGTLRRMPGLLPFRMGAFSIAVEAAVPVIPVAFRGVRTILRDGQWFPRHGNISVQIGEPIAPGGEDFHAAVRLRDKARAQMLALTGEPDLAGETIEMPGAEAADD